MSRFVVEVRTGRDEDDFDGGFKFKLEAVCAYHDYCQAYPRAEVTLFGSRGLMLRRRAYRRVRVAARQFGNRVLEYT